MLYEVITVPQGQTVLSARHGDQNPIVLAEHFLRPDGLGRLIVDEGVETVFAKRRMVPRQLDRSFAFTLGAVH